MRTFYIFKINENYIGLARKKPDNIYILLKSIYNYDKKDIIVAFDLFTEICSPINIDFFNNYIFSYLKKEEEYTKFKNIHMYHNYFTSEESKMIINKSHIKIKSNKLDNIFLNNLRDITDLFVTDFIHEYYNYFKNDNKTTKKI